MGGLVFLGLIVIFVGYIAITTKMSNLKHRAKQQALKNTGISSSDISAGIAGAFEKKQLQKFLEEHSNFTEESIKEVLKQYAVKLINKNQISEFSEDVCKKIEEDSKLEKMQEMEFRRVTIGGYCNPRLIATVVFTDNRDEYEISLHCNLVNENVQVEKYQIRKGAVVGF